MKATHLSIPLLLNIFALSALLPKAAAASPMEPYAYCSKDSCRTVYAPPAFFFGQLPGEVLTHCIEPHTYAMTFDDGPASNYPKVLEILARKDVKATFFTLGSKLGGPTEQNYLQLAAAAGHQISNHTFSHLDLMKMTDEEVIKEVGSNEEAIVKVLGDSPQVRHDAQVVRPPFGYVDARVYNLLKSHGNKVVRWNSDRSDWELNEADVGLELRRLDQHLEFASSQSPSGTNDSIIDLNHDFSGATLENLETMIDRIKAKGYRFVKINECIGN